MLLLRIINKFFQLSGFRTNDPPRYVNGMNFFA
ncbi:uncharacterized protein METZ01_LOCUS303716 [marine metagenome]|uniref:Uncharacterized protein n=1 Tax=marine metagenome TaxID=408172 RepID=A0A382MTP3_9ZZZZ